MWPVVMQQPCRFYKNLEGGQKLNPMKKISLITPAYYLIFMAGITLITAITSLSNNQSLGPLRNPTRSRMQMNLQ